MERLPEVRTDFQRQELFKGLYFQRETSLGYYQMKWRDWDSPRLLGNRVDPKNYSAFRFDMLNMFYYPLKFFDINFIPRAGFRMTAYGESSKQAVTADDLNHMIDVNSLGSNSSANIINYDKKGGSKFRFAGEIGLEVNTKFYRTWQNVKSEILGLNGIRHVLVPYINYTFIPKPSESADHLYYFDEIDRIEENHFIRLGMVNRLQTRRNGKIYEWITMENYWDYFFHESNDFNHIGDFGTILTFRPTEKVTLRSELLLDLGQTNSHDAQAYRGNRAAGRPGLSNKYFNRFNISLNWDFAPRWNFAFGYSYSDDYIQRNPYSMGTTLSAVTASSLFFSHKTRGQEISASLHFPVIDKKTDGYIACSYDVETALFSNLAIGLTRKLHCWSVSAAIGKKTERTGEDYSKEDSYYFAFFITLTAMPQASFGHRLDN